MSFLNSTQYLQWKFDSNTLYQKRMQTNVTDANGWNVEYAMMMEKWYTRKIQEICNTLRFPEKIQATSITFFKRFYLHNCMLHIPPKYIMLTCIYLACKVEESHEDAYDLGQKMKDPVDGSIILNSEIQLLTSLKFHLNVYHPYKPAFGFIRDMLDKNLFGVDLAKRLENHINHLIHDSLNEDLMFLYPPSQIALAAISVASMKENGTIDVYKYLRSHFNSDSQVMDLMSNISLIENFMKQNMVIPKQEEIAMIEAKFPSLLQ